MKEAKRGRPIELHGMAYAPTNEQGVVFLFGRLAPRLGFHVEVVQTHFPDCIARRRGKECRIEFEFRASSYVSHPPRGADVVVCWDNDWSHRPAEYAHLEIIDLKSHVGALPRVFTVGCDEVVRGKKLDKYKRLLWSVPSNAQVDDLIVMYRKSPASEIRDLWKVVGPFEVTEWGLEAILHRIADLKSPLTYNALKADPITRQLGVVRNRFQGKTDITDDWPLLASRILKLNSGLKATLRKFVID
jgi:hypothetical protein